MHPSPKSLLLPLALSCATIGLDAQLPAQEQGVKLPDSYQNFFPTATAGRAVMSQEQAIELFNAKRTEKFVPHPERIGAPLRAAATDDTQSNIYGYLYFFQGTELSQGFYRIDPFSGATHLWTDEYTDWGMTMTAGWLRDGNLCGVNTMKFMGGILGYGQVEMELATGKILNFKQLRVDNLAMQNIYTTMAYRDLDGRIYGYGFNPNGDGYGFNSADASDIDTSEMLLDVTYDEVCTALCYNVQDDLFYGVTTKGKFVSIDMEGSQEELFDLNIPGLRSTVTGLVYSPKDKAYIFNAYLEDGSAEMYAIDPQAQTATKIYSCPFGQEYIFMVCTDENADQEAPTKPAFNSCDFEGASLSGTATFTMPNRNVAGQTVTSTLDWRLFIDGNPGPTGTAVAGSKVSVPLENLYNGKHNFAFSAGLNGNFSVPVTFTTWVGSDYPVAPENIVLTENKLTWDAVTEGIHEGYVDASTVSYIVYLNGTKVTETADTECAIELPQDQPFTSYTATVVAKADNKESEPGTSNYITYGNPLTLDPSIHFRPEEHEFELFKAIDIDGNTDEEGNTRNWHFSTTMGFPSFASGAAGDDLLIFPPIDFTNTDKAYLFQMEAGLIHDRDNTGTIEVWIGKEPTVEGMTQLIIPATRLYYMRGIIMQEYFAVNEPGTYYIGVRTKTNQVGMHISDMDIALSDRAADVPMTVTDLTLTPGENGALTATVSFTMPTKTVNDKPIPQDANLTATVIAREYVVNKPNEGETISTKTISGAPGSKQTVEITTLQNYNTIAVSCALDGRSGAEMNDFVYTGLVKPYIVQNLKAEVSEDNMSVHLSWTPPVEGEEEGVIGDSFYYSVWFYNDGWEFLDGVGYDVLETDIALPDGAGQQYVTLGIMALNDAGQSDHISSLTCVLGAPYTLPMIETLPDYLETYSPIMIQRPSKDYEGTYWRVSDPAEVYALFANESGVAYIGYIGNEGQTSGASRLSLPKFSTKGVKDVKLTLTYWGGPYEATFFLWANKFNATEPEYLGDFPTGDGWITNTINIPDAYLGLDWVELLLDSEFNSANSYAMFSAYTISGVSGIEGVSADGTGRVFTTPGMLHVAGFAGQPLTVTDLSGRTLVSVPELEDLAGYALLPGIYVVKAGTTVKKIAVK